MANLSITAANVAWVSGPIDKDDVAGEAFVAGAIVYLNTDGTWKKAKAGGTAIEAGQNGIGMALATADAANARVSVARPGAVVAVGAGAAGLPYMISATAGSLCPFADLIATNKTTPAALGIGTSQLLLMYAYNAGAVN